MLQRHLQRVAVDSCTGRGRRFAISGQPVTVPVLVPGGGIKPQAAICKVRSLVVRSQALGHLT